ncbi:hypothetical protein [Bacillus sp. MRMR6]|uniref:hypothetical protein n=1 Tax=Bacillus sp. MRMR6 TaxID=1928617 RepID=UPI00095165B0|nr:hypothetical protein [Bacillus sp. MRMR6]OLS38588.1 hypothetical protein BTR25_14315 [Bacillus sp. MRMR6]
MKKLFTVKGKTFPTAVIRAESKVQALTIFVRNQPDSEFYLSAFTTFSPHEGFFSCFFADEYGHFYKEDTSIYEPHLLQMHEETRESYMFEWIEKNIRTHWHNQPQFAEEYICNWKKHTKGSGTPAAFSDEFMLYNIKNLVEFNYGHQVEINELSIDGAEYQPV